MIHDQAVAHHIYYVAQEAILNAVKHGQAERIEMELSVADSGVFVLAVRDNGVGMTSGPTPNRGMGIRIMKYRARMIGAELQVQPRPGGGTEVSCRFVDGPKAAEEPPLKTELTH